MLEPQYVGLVMSVMEKFLEWFSKNVSKLKHFSTDHIQKWETRYKE